jgi:hypothetical protein
MAIFFNDDIIATIFDIFAVTAIKSTHNMSKPRFQLSLRNIGDLRKITKK